jgi:DNA-binding NtrC family response regulator
MDTMIELAGDRFLRAGRVGWIDLATGAAMRVDVGALPVDWAARERALTAELTAGDTFLVDFGRVGVAGWFEARRDGRPAARRGQCALASDRGHRVAELIGMAARDAGRRGARIVECPVAAGEDAERLAEAAARDVRRIGLVPIRAGPSVPPALMAALARRHVALFVWDEAGMRAIDEWRRALSAASPRVHVIVLLQPDRAAGRPRLLAPARPDRENPRMPLADVLLPVLEIVHDAEDESAALAAAARWLRRATGADAMAFLGPPASAPVLAIGWTRADLGIVEGMQAAGAASHSREGIAHAAAPIRYGGRPIGWLAVRGRDEGAADRLAAIEAAAALLAPAVRARLDAIALSRASHAAMPEILGTSPAIGALRDAIARAAAAPFAVLLEGESGTGKELAARAIHRLGPRRDRRFGAVNCAALSDDLVEAELFGHTRGAFTGAVGPRAGLFEDAHGGSLFLDEVGELSPRAQAKLLRVLQEGEVRRVGENAARQVNVRVIAATNRSLTDMAGQGAFREDLLFRLAVVRIRLPPLRERVEDIAPIALACWTRLAHEAGKRARLGPDALTGLCRHHWPGNVRELQNAMAGLVMLAPDRGRVTRRHVDQVIGAAVRPADEVAPLEVARTRWEQRVIAGTLARHGGRQSAAARELGLTRQGLRKAMKRLGLDDRRPPRTAGVA